MIQSSSHHSQQQPARSKDVQQCRDKDCHNLNDDIRVETFCRNKAASVLSLIALLPFPPPPLPCKSDWSGARSQAAHMYVSCFVTAQMTSAPAADAKHGAVRGAGKMRRWILMASARKMRGTGMIRCDQMSKDLCIFINSYDDAVELPVSPAGNPSHTPPPRKLMESSAYDARTIDFAKGQ